MSGIAQHAGLQEAIAAEEATLVRIEKSPACNTMLAAAMAVHLNQLRAELTASDTDRHATENTQEGHYS